MELLHNYVDGLALGTAWKTGRAAGLSSTIAVVAHEIPQEIGDCAVLKMAGFGNSRLLFWNFIVSLTIVLGVATIDVIGETATTSGSAEQLKKICIAVTAGSFLSLSLYLMMPQVMQAIASHAEALEGKKSDSKSRRKLMWRKVQCYAECFVVGTVGIAIVYAVGLLE